MLFQKNMNRKVENFLLIGAKEWNVVIAVLQIAFANIPELEFVKMAGLWRIFVIFVARL